MILLIHNCRGYDHRVPNPAMPGEFYAEVSYRCANGFDFDTIERSPNGNQQKDKFNKLYCSEGRWEGRIPECIERSEENFPDEFGSDCPAEDQERLGCEQSCVLLHDNDGKGSASCKCHVGYTLSEDDARTCLGT